MLAGSERGLQGKSDSTSHREWEGGEFPILCEGCLGENPYIRMMTDKYGGVCKMCSRPFTIFKWRPGRGEGYKKTEVCMTCSKVKNVCQTCILDLQFGLPSQLRDAVLASVEGAVALPESDVSKEYHAQQQMALIADGNNPWSAGSDMETPNEKLLKLARNASTNRAQPRIQLPASFIQNNNAITGNKRPLDSDIVGSSVTQQVVIPEVTAPPGILSNDQLLSTVNFNRLPAGFRVFAKIDPASVSDVKFAPPATETTVSTAQPTTVAKKSSETLEEIEEEPAVSDEKVYIQAFSKEDDISQLPAKKSKATSKTTPSKESSAKAATENTTTKESKPKFAPKPPSGPPPLAAFAK